ncbi:unnamed protein product [Ostreobium quekettii]|uniref:JmjC domain-containing protein n=1 Tax=Ostreobium quekettii TaxID=121088 RepID=A0A8S1IZY4_9CHLO|nr:unnamed protein product [Ostreobium quekettii]
MMVSPSYLLSQGVPVKKIIQKPGQLVVSFPRAYHSGFSHGWNCAEAVNFALMDWLPIGHKAVTSYRNGCSGRSPNFSHDQLLWDLCQDALVSADKAAPRPHKSSVDVPADDRLILYREFHALVERELAQREPVRNAGFLEFQVQKAWDGEPFQCIACKNMHYLSFCVCPCRKEVAGTLCLEHFLEATCPCKNSSKVLCIQVPDVDLLRARDALRSITNGACEHMALPVSEVAANSHIKQEYSVMHREHVVQPAELPRCQGTSRDGETTGHQNSVGTSTRVLNSMDRSGSSAAQVGNSRCREEQNIAREGNGAKVDQNLASSPERRKRLKELQSPKGGQPIVSTSPAEKKLRSS